MLNLILPVTFVGRCPVVPTGIWKPATLSTITTSLFIVNVPVAAPMLTDVAAPKAFIVVAFVLNTLKAPVSSVIIFVPFTSISLSAFKSLSAVISLPAWMSCCVLKPPVICTAPVVLLVAFVLFCTISLGVVPSFIDSEPSVVTTVS